MSYKINETIVSPNQSTRDGLYPQLIVLHICDGYYEGTKATFMSAANQVSSHFIVGRDGKICKCVDLIKMAWCNGTSPTKTDSKYYGHSTVGLVQKLGGNANKYSVSIECEGLWKETKGALTDKQLEAVVWLIQYIQNEVKRLYNLTIPFDREHIVGHYQITPKTRPYCPGEAFPWDELIKKLGGSTISTTTSNTQVIYRVQVGSFTLKTNAETFLSKVKASGYKDSFITQDNAGNYKVQVGAFTAKKNAESYMNEIKIKGYEAFIVTVNK